MPVKATSTTQTYKNAAGAELTIKTVPMKFGTYTFKFTKPGDKWASKGKYANTLESMLHQADAGEPVKAPAAAGEGVPAKPHAYHPELKMTTGLSGAAYEPATTYDLGTGNKLYTSETTNAWALKGPGPYGEKVIASGYGQESLNQAFEALHPRGAGGKFEAKPGQKDFLTEINQINPNGDWIEKFDGFDGTMYGNASGGILSIDKKDNSWGYYAPDGSKTVATNKGDDLASLHKWLSGTGAPEVPPVAKPAVEVGKLKKVGPQLGSNPGFQGEDEAGQKYYVKTTPSEEHAKNERLAAALYALAGSGTLQYRDAGDDKKAVVTEMQNLSANNVSQLNSAQRLQAQADFATHAWLANWDAVGATGDNIGVGPAASKPLNLDLGGSLAYRAKGTPKGELFGNSAGEWDTLRDSIKNPQAAGLFKSMTPEQLKASADRLKKVSNDQIHAAVKAAGYEGEAGAALYLKLAMRRDDVIKRAQNTLSPEAAAAEAKKKTEAAAAAAAEAKKKAEEQFLEKKKAHAAAAVPVAQVKASAEAAFEKYQASGYTGEVATAYMKVYNELSTHSALLSPEQETARALYVGSGYESMNESARTGTHSKNPQVKGIIYISPLTTARD